MSNIKCPKCSNEQDSSFQYCHECGFNIGYFEAFGTEQPSTPKKISGMLNSIDSKRFMYREKTHHADIRSRRLLPNGTIGRFDGRGRRIG